MATQLPFSLLEGFLQNLTIPLEPPAWAVDETHRRIVSLLNHILMQEPQAMERLRRNKGRTVLMQWRTMTFKVLVTPAGLLDVAPACATSDLVLAITQESPLAIAQALMQGGKPTVRIEGDVQLAAEVNWLIDNVRWDLEEDLARLLGDAPAHGLVQMVGAVAHAVRQLVGRTNNSGSTGSNA